MASPRMLPDTVMLANYIGEIDGVASYQYTELRRVYCPMDSAVTKGQYNGRAPSNNADLYIFDRTSIAVDENGDRRSFLPYPDWKAAADKTPYWTLSESGRDYFVKKGDQKRMSINSVSHKIAGTPRMWHFEVIGK